MNALRKTKHTLQFQFHKGTIKPALSNLALQRSQIFQFHKGTIKPLLH